MGGANLREVCEALQSSSRLFFLDLPANQPRVVYYPSMARTVVTSVSRNPPNRRGARSVASTVSQGPRRTIVSQYTTRTRASKAQRKPAGVAFMRPPAATPSVAGNTHQVMCTAAGARGYWDALSHKIPPKLSSTFGNYTCVNSLDRFAFTTTPNTHHQFLICHSYGACRVLRWDSVLFATAANFSAYQQTQLNASNTVPLDIRPLRLSFRIRNTTQNLNIASSVVIAQVPQSLQLNFTSVNQFDTSTQSSLWQLVQSDPGSRTLSGKELTRAHTVVCPPSSFVKYNSYEEWSALSSFVDGSSLTVADWYSLFKRDLVPPTFPYSTRDGMLSDIPAQYITMLNFQPNPLAQTYEFEIFSQDGIRYPANTMAAAVRTHGTPNPGQIVPEAVIAASASAASEDSIAPSDSVSQAGNYVSRIIDGIGYASSGYTNARAIGSAVSGLSKTINASRYGRTALAAAELMI